MGIDVFIIDEETGDPILWLPEKLDALGIFPDKPYTRFGMFAGHCGHLRESYHGSPYATSNFVREGFAAGGEGVEISASDLQSRLNDAKKDCRERCEKLYSDMTEDELKKAEESYEDFTKLASSLEKSTGKPCKILVSY